MLDLYYTASSIFSLFILFIVNRNVFIAKQDKLGYKEYIWFIHSIGLFLIADCSWGLVRMFMSTQWLYYDAVLYNITMIFTVCMCCRYVAKFLELQNKKGRFLNFFGWAFFVCDIIVVIVNFFSPILFWVDDSGDYHVGIARKIGIAILIALFVVLVFTTVYAIKDSQGDKRNKLIAICQFSCAVSITLIIQAIIPEFPCFSTGLVVGAIIIYVRIHVAEQTSQLASITQLNKRLEESHAMLRKNAFELEKQKQMLLSSNIATWELIIKPGCRERLKVDSKMKELMGIPADSTISEEEVCEMLVSRVNPHDLPLFLEYDQKLRNGIRSECTYRWNNPVLGERYVRCGGSSVSHEEGVITCYGYHYDVTEMISLENELKISLAESEAKTKFIQNMSHEIRTPLNAMFGFSQLLGMPDGTWDDAEKDKYNKIIYNSFVMLEMHVNDILDSADVQHGNYRMEMSEFAVNEVCEIAMMSVEFRRPGNVEMKFTTDLDDKHTIYSDSRRIQQILVNYLTNACKHTAKGMIHLHVTDKEIPGKIVFSCSDTGHGVPVEQAEAVFGRYKKLDQNVQGSGLGLNICNIIAHKLDAKVYMDTNYTNGACFKLEIANR